jgi:hypothetical protein
MPSDAPESSTSGYKKTPEQQGVLTIFCSAGPNPQLSGAANSACVDAQPRTKMTVDVAHLLESLRPLVRSGQNRRSDGTVLVELLEAGLQFRRHLGVVLIDTKKNRTVRQTAIDEQDVP